MARVVDSREQIEDHIAGLETTYGSFPVNQTTISLSGEQYERVSSSHEECIDVYVEVENESNDILHVRQEGSVELPNASISADGAIEPQVRDVVRERTGVQCALDGIDCATIAGLRNAAAEETDTLYHLVVVFEATREGGTVDDDALWQSSPESVRPLYA